MKKSKLSDIERVLCGMKGSPDDWDDDWKIHLLGFAWFNWPHLYNSGSFRFQAQRCLTVVRTNLHPALCEADFWPSSADTQSMASLHMQEAIGSSACFPWSYLQVITGTDPSLHVSSLGRASCVSRNDLKANEFDWVLLYWRCTDVMFQTYKISCHKYCFL